MLVADHADRAFNPGAMKRPVPNCAFWSLSSLGGSHRAAGVGAIVSHSNTGLAARPDRARAPGSVSNDNSGTTSAYRVFQRSMCATVPVA